MLDIATTLKAQRRGLPVGMVSVCSAHPAVMRAALGEAARRGTQAIIEATSAQVNQAGGYTGLTPAAFVKLVRQTADAVGLPRERVTIGGDQLGPQPWRDERIHRAMANAHRLVREYVAAGATKLHIDATMRLFDDPDPLPLATIAARTADLVATAEQTHKGLPVGLPDPLYVIGTRRPDLQDPSVTDVETVEEMLRLTKAAFEQRVLKAALPRIVAVMVDAGIGFTAAEVIAYEATGTADLSAYFARSKLPYEAARTDYQTEESLRAMVGDHFAFLKVGPSLTYAYREAVFNLAEIEAELFGTRKGSVKNVRDVVANMMRAHPDHWRDYYPYKAPEREWLFGFTDRVRFYWSFTAVQSAVATLMANLDAEDIPLPLLSQYMPQQFAAVRRGEIAARPVALIDHTIAMALRRHTGIERTP